MATKTDDYKIKRKRYVAEKKIIDFLLDVDKSGFNANIYKELFEKMSDKEFDKFMRDILNDEETLCIEVDQNKPGEGYPTVNEIKNLADKYNIQLEEYVYFPHKNPEEPERPLRTYSKVPIIMVTIRRLQQIADNQNAASNDTSVVNLLTGQVTGKSKAAAISNMETISLLSINNLNSIKEFLGPRSDDPVAKAQMLENINLTGKFYLKDVTTRFDNKQSIKTLISFFRGAGLEPIIKTKAEEETEKEK